MAYIKQIQVGETTYDIKDEAARESAASKVTDVKVGQTSIVDPSTKVATIDPDSLGKVDNVLVNGDSVVTDKVASIIVPTKMSDLDNDMEYTTITEMEQAISNSQISNVSISVDANVGTPSADATINNNTLNLSFSNLKGTKGDKGDTGDTGATGAQGASAVFDPDTGNILATLENTTGQSTSNAMTQKATTDAIEDAKTEILVGVESNYISGKGFRDGIKDFAGWGIYKENIPYQSGTQLTWVYGEYMQNGPALVFLDSNGNVLTSYWTQGGTSRNITYTNENVAYVNCSFKLTYSNTYNGCPLTIGGVQYLRVEKQPSLNDVDVAVSGFDTRITALDTRTTALETDDERRIYPLEGLRLWSTDGRVLPASSGWYISDNYIPCSAGASVIYRFGAYADATALIFYNENKNFIQSFSANVVSGIRNTTAPANTCYVRISFYKTYNGNANTTPLAINGVNYFVDEISPMRQLESRISDLEDNSLRLYTRSDVAYGANGNVIAASGWSLCTNYVPCSPNDTILFRYGVMGSGIGIIFYDENKNYLDMRYANEGIGYRSFSAPANTCFVRTSFYKTYGGEANTNPLIINSTKYYVDEVSKIPQMEIDLYAKDTTHGQIGLYYPEQVYDITKPLAANPNGDYFKRLQFIHVSDTHGGNFGYAEEFVDYCTASFVANTGDLVADKFTDNKATTIASAIAPTKPTYLVLGNHDYASATTHESVFNAFYGDAETEGTINYHNVNSGGVATTATYYSVDYSTPKVKCIFLDMNDGWADLTSVAFSSLSLGCMSQAQIEWFIAELQSAKTNGYHVCCFIHIPGDTFDGERIVNEFTDFWNRGNLKHSLQFLNDIVDKFISGGTISFTYNSNDYSATFSSGGHFVSWFCGHSHWDVVGWHKNYPNQFCVVITRARYQSLYGGVYEGDKLGVHWNFVTVDTGHQSLSVYRVGQQKTVFGVDRKNFRIYYK